MIKTILLGLFAAGIAFYFATGVNAQTTTITPTTTPTVSPTAVPGAPTTGFGN